ncbi:MAG: glycosyltransferase, partial [Desulfonatronovibrio sp.]
FIDDMKDAYAFASLVVCRAGATTLAELCVTGKPSILIPFPYATHNHQMTNARYLEHQGAALVLDQSYLQEVNAARVIGDLLS